MNKLVLPHVYVREDPTLPTPKAMPKEIVVCEKEEEEEEEEEGKIVGINSRRSLCAKTLKVDVVTFVMFCEYGEATSRLEMRC